MIPSKKINRAGRKKGSVNVCTANVRAAFQLLINSNLEQLENDLKKLSPKDRVDAIIKLSGYILPKLQSIDLSSESHFDNFKPIEITFINEN